VRYELSGPPKYAGYCCCEDCRKASGSGFIPFIGVLTSAMSLTGKTTSHTLALSDGRDATRNFCPVCSSLVFGGFLSGDEVTVYAGTLDDASWFKPTIAIFTRDRPAWVILPPDLKCFDGLPGG
jgi:hypothetical protein